ncbi:MAG: M28 family peptidase [Acidimicrobiales bacterium]
MKVTRAVVGGITAGALLATSLSSPVQADNGTNSAALRAAVGVAGMTNHLNAFQAIANSNGGTRAAGTAGYDASVAYVQGQLTAAGYAVTVQPFSYDKFIENTPATLSRTSPSPTTDYVYGADFFTMDYSGSGETTAAVTPVDLLLPPTGGSTSGCEASDFAGFPPGNIALLQRGTCTFRVKVDNAAAAGANGVIIFNEGNAPDRVDLFGGTLSPPLAPIPVVSASFARGQEWATTAGLTLHLTTDTAAATITTNNVLADTPGGRADRMVVVGAHLDSVAEGSGINDNGSGSAAILEIARKLAGTNVRNKVRFAFWGGEEDGLIGSTHYVNQLSKTDIKRHAANLNFDMLASPNFVRFVYDGDGSASTVGPNGSDVIERVFNQYFAGQGLATEPTAFDGRSDYGPFIAAGIPAGGLFSGAEDLKTATEAAIYGGTAGAPHDPCYHLACDTITNINATSLEQLADGAAHAVLTLAMTTSAVNGTGQGNGKGVSDLEYVGPLARR